MLYPIGFSQFHKIINSAKYGIELDEDDESSLDYRFIHIKDRQSTWYDQQDNMDNLISS